MHEAFRTLQRITAVRAPSNAALTLLQYTKNYLDYSHGMTNDKQVHSFFPLGKAHHGLIPSFVVDLVKRG